MTCSSLLLSFVKRTFKDSHGKLTSDDSLQEAMSELRTLLERFANGMSMAVIGDAMQALWEDAQKDEELREWFRSVDAYMRKVCRGVHSVSS